MTSAARLSATYPFVTPISEGVGAGVPADRVRLYHVLYDFRWGRTDPVSHVRFAVGRDALNTEDWSVDAFVAPRTVPRRFGTFGNRDLTLLQAGAIALGAMDERGLWVAGLLALVAFWPITLYVMGDVLRNVPFEIGGVKRLITVWHLWGAAVVGLALTGFLVWITEYYTGTDYSPVKHVAAALEGSELTVRSTLREIIDGRKLRFGVEVR